MRGQLHALRFASGKRSGGLAQPQVAESDLFEHAKLLSNLGSLGEELQRFLHREVEDFVNILSPVPDIEHLGLVARPLAFLANQFDVGEKLHLNRDGAVALTGLAAAAWNVERKMPGGKSTLLRLRQGSEQIADAIERLDVGHRVRARRASDGRLIHQHDVVQIVRTLDAVPVWSGRLAAIGLLLRAHQRLIKHVVQQARLARSRYTRDGHDHAQRNLQIDTLQVVCARAPNLDGLWPGFAPVVGQLNAQVLGKIPSCQRCGVLLDFRVRSSRDDLAAVLAGPGPKVKNAVRRLHDVGIMLNHENRVPQIAQVVQNLDETMRVAAVQPDRRFIENI